MFGKNRVVFVLALLIVAGCAGAEEAPMAEEAPADKPKRRSRAKKADAVAPEANAEAPAEAKPKAKAVPKPRAKPAAKAAPKPASKTAAKKSAAAPAEEGDSTGPRKSGWWQRTFG